jgi:hypothetical protein
MNTRRWVLVVGLLFAWVCVGRVVANQPGTVVTYLEAALNVNNELDKVVAFLTKDQVGKILTETRSAISDLAEKKCVLRDQLSSGAIPPTFESELTSISISAHNLAEKLDSFGEDIQSTLPGVGSALKSAAVNSLHKKALDISQLQELESSRSDTKAMTAKLDQSIRELDSARQATDCLIARLNGTGTCAVSAFSIGSGGSSICTGSDSTHWRKASSER